MDETKPLSDANRVPEDRIREDLREEIRKEVHQQLLEEQRRRSEAPKVNEDWANLKGYLKWMLFTAIAASIIIWVFPDMDVRWQLTLAAVIGCVLSILSVTLPDAWRARSNRHAANKDKT